MAKVPFVIADECTGCGLCESSLPDVFQLISPDNKFDLVYATVINPHGASENEIQEIIDACPVNAIIWKDK